MEMMNAFSEIEMICRWKEEEGELKYSGATINNPVDNTKLVCVSNRSHYRHRRVRLIYESGFTEIYNVNDGTLVVDVNVICGVLHHAMKNEKKKKVCAIDIGENRLVELSISGVENFNPVPEAVGVVVDSKEQGRRIALGKNGGLAIGDAIEQTKEAVRFLRERYGVQV